MELTDFLGNSYKIGDVVVFSNYRNTPKAGIVTRITENGNVIMSGIVYLTGKDIYWHNGKTTQYAPINSVIKIDVKDYHRIRALAK